MVKQNLNHTMFFVLGILAISTVLKYNLSETIWTKSQREIAEKQKDYQVFITEDEVKEFIRLWPEFYELGLEYGTLSSSQIEHPETLFDWKKRLWFVYHRQDAVRFFYVQQRIDYLLQTMEIKRNARALINQLSAQQKSGKKSQIVQEMIEFQKRRYEAEKINEQEKALMDAYETELKELLQRYPPVFSAKQ